MIYLDNSATTVPDPSVIKSFQKVSEKYFGNPSSIHELGGEVEKLHNQARMQAAQLLEVAQNEIVFTSGGTEGNNLAIKGIAFKHQGRGKHIITSAIEHASVYEACKSLEDLGFRITYLPVNGKGQVDPAQVEAAIREDTILVSIMHVNNEIGSVQPINEIGTILNKYPKVFFHVDAVQGIGKVPLSLKKSLINVCTISGHKINGLKGTGLLYVKEGTTLFPLFHGGNQEFGLRSGTENVAGNVSFVRALRLMKEKEQHQLSRLTYLHDYLYEELADIDGVIINSPKSGAPHIINVSMVGLKPEVVIHALYEKGIIISTQSACSSKKSDKSRVLSSCGYSDERAISGLRLSLSYDTTENELTSFIKALIQINKQLKEILE